MNVNIFRAIGDLALGAKKRTDKEHDDFLAFYRQLVETLPVEVVELYGELKDISLKRDGKIEKSNLELSIADFLWWQHEITVAGTRFTHGVAEVKSDMLQRLVQRAETQRLSPEERAKLLLLAEQPVG